MESVYDTEVLEVYPETFIQNEFENIEFENIIKSVNDSRITQSDTVNETSKIDVDDYGINALSNTTSEIVVVSDEPKAFENAGFETCVVFCLGVIVGILVVKMFTQRWHT